MATHTNTHIGVPLFSIDSVTQGPDEGEQNGLEKGSVVIAGGGGSSRSGIANVVSVLSIELNGDGDARANAKYQYTTGSELSMVLSASPDGRFIACSVSEGTLLLEHSVEEGGLVKAGQFATDFPDKPEDPTQEPKTGCQNTVRFDNSSRKFATGGEDKTVRIWSIEDGPLLPKPLPDTPPPPAASTATEHKGSELEADKDGNGKSKQAEEEKSPQEVHDPRRWMRRRVNKVKELKGHRGEIKDLSYHPSGLLLASVSSDHTCRLWNTVTGSQLQVLPSDSSRGLTYRGCRFVNDTTLLTLQVPRVRGGDSYIVVWSVSGEFSPVARWELRKVHVVAPKGVATTIASSTCGRVATVGGADGSVSIVDTSKWQIARKIPEVQGLPVTAITITNCVRGRIKLPPKEGEKVDVPKTVTRYGELYVVSVSMDKLLSMVPVTPKRPRKVADPAMMRSINKKWNRVVEAESIEQVFNILTGTALQRQQQARYPNQDGEEPTVQDVVEDALAAASNSVDESINTVTEDDEEPEIEVDQELVGESASVGAEDDKVGNEHVSQTNEIDGTEQEEAIDKNAWEENTHAAGHDSEEQGDQTEIHENASKEQVASGAVESEESSNELDVEVSAESGNSDPHGDVGEDTDEVDPYEEELDEQVVPPPKVESVSSKEWAKDRGFVDEEEEEYNDPYADENEEQEEDYNDGSAEV